MKEKQRYWLSGIGMYWIIIELLHQQPDGKMKYETFKSYLDFYTKSEGRGAAFSQEIEHMFIKSKLLLKKNGHVLSNRVLLNKRMRKEISEKRSFAGKKSAEILLCLSSTWKDYGILGRVRR